MSDQLSSEQPKVSRRTALSMIGAAGLAATFGWWFRQNLVDPDDPRFQLISQEDKMATQIALSQTDEHIAATSQAYVENFPALASEVAKIPRVLFINSLRLQLEFSGKTPTDPHRISTVSATAIDSHLAVLTDHTVFPSDDFKNQNNLGEVVGMSSSTPQLVEKHDIQLSKDQFSVYRLPKSDLSIVKSQANSFIDSETFPTINSNWRPQVGDMTHALGFPTYASDKSVYMPYNYSVSHIRRNFLILKGIVGSGSSGSGVVNEAGELIGVINQISASGARATRLDEDFVSLIAQARN